MSKIERIYRRLCSFSVLRELISKDLIKYFFEFARAEEQNERLNKYGAFVNEIYEGGGSLVQCIRKMLFENENVYVRAVAKKIDINKNEATVSVMLTVASLN